MQQLFLTNKKPVFSLVLLLLVFMAACKKLVQVGSPSNALTTENVYSSNTPAIAVLTDMYAQMASRGVDFGPGSMSLLTGLSADELIVFPGANDYNNYLQYYTNTLNNTNVGVTDFWGLFYHDIFICNAALEGLSNSNGLTPAVKQQLTGEAKFMRAFCYFHLLNLYGNVPLVTSSDYNANAGLPRSDTSLIYRQIFADLNSAEGMLSENYPDQTLVNNSPDKVRPTKWAAVALLARSYLYAGKYDSAEMQADMLINTSRFKLTPLNAAFLRSSDEAIWQLQPVNAGRNTEDGWTFILLPTGPDATHPVYLSNYLVNAFESGDHRRSLWIDSVITGGLTYYYPYKYKSATLNAPLTEYSMVLRLGEQYLIRAEARAWQNDLNGARNDLDSIRIRAGLAPTTAANRADLLSAILHERQVELFTEWGHRWLDLKRTGTVDKVMGAPGNVCAAKGGTWNTNWQWYPILLSELQADPHLTQNSGY